MISQETPFAGPGSLGTGTGTHSAGPLPNTNRGRENGGRLKKNSDLQAAATALGWFSIGLGAVEFLFPKRLARAIGTPPKPFTMRLTGLREIGVGVGILAAERKAGWIKARVAGDAMDLAMLKSSFDSRRANRIRLAAATAGVAAVTAADFVYGRRFKEEEADESQSHGSRVRVEASMAVNKTPAECYEFWRKLENFPKFMKNVETVETGDDGRTHWKVRAGLGTWQWDAEITQDTPDEAISWRSTEGAEIANSGSVRFEPRLANLGTNVRLAMEYDPPAAGVGAPNGLLEMISEHRVRENLHRFKSVIECGEFPTTEGQPSGRHLTERKAKQ
jgi:uncharacterized membrane protein